MLTLSLGLLAGGCASAGPAPGTDPTTEPGSVRPSVVAAPAAQVTEAAIEADLAALRALQIVSAGELVVNVPEENRRCYNLPCNDADREVWAAERARQGTRLHALLETAQAVAAQPLAEQAPDSAAIDASLEALRALQIVEVQALAVELPANHHDCYGPCPTDAAYDAAAARAVALADAMHTR